jgi:hypothetical protein
MINFRFHLVSLIAVFLALGLGILVGSSVVDRVIVDRLDHEINTVKAESKASHTEIGKLTDRVNRSDDFMRRVSAYAVAQRLSGVPVALVADRGVDSGAVKNMLATLRAAGADVPGVIWLNESWQLPTDKDLTSLENTTGVSGNAATARVDAMKLLARRLAEPQQRSSSKNANTDLLQTLHNAGFVDLTDGDRTAFQKFPTRAARVLVLTGTNSRLTGSDTLVDLTQSLVANNVPTVVGEVYDDHNGATPIPERGATVLPVRGDATLGKQVSTLDDAELPEGGITAAIELEQSVDGTVGHYGYGQGASAPLPTISS